MSMLRTQMVWIALSLTLAACGARPDFASDYADAMARDDLSAGERGWWRLLAGEPERAGAAFGGQTDALSALGRAWLARAALDAPQALAEATAATRAAKPGSRVALLGRLWAEEAAASMAGGAARLKAALGDHAAWRKALKASGHTSRVSFLPWLDLRRLRQEGVGFDDKKRLLALGKRWAVKPATPRPDRDGLIASIWPLKDGVAHLEIEARGPVLAWRGGRLVYTDDPDRFPPVRRRFSAPGEGPLVLIWASSQTPKAWQWAHAAPIGLAGEPRWLTRALRLMVTLHDEEPEAAARWLAGAPETPFFEALRARAVADDPGLPGRQRQDAGRAHLTAAQAAAPRWVELAQARLDARSGDHEAALARLESLAKQVPDHPEVARLRFVSLMALGFGVEAREALDRALALAPDRCALLKARDTLAQREGDPDAQLTLVEAATRCGKPLQAARSLLTLGRYEDALNRLDALASARPKSDAVHSARGRALLALGRLEEAQAAFKKSKQATDQLAAVDLGLTAASRPALQDLDLAGAESLSALVKAHPRSHEAIKLIQALPAHSPFRRLAYETERIIERYEAQTVPLPGPAVRVLDHSAMMVFKNGKSLRWVHEVIAIRSREAAEYYGELGLPEEAWPIAVYTRKADGQRLYADEIPEKETLSLPSLDDGDYLVALYLEPGDNGYLYNHGFLTPRVYFKGVDLPTFKQRFEILPFSGPAPDVQRLAGGPEGIPFTADGRKGVRFEALNTLRQPREDHLLPAGLWLPSVRVGRKVKLAEDLDYIRDRLLARRRRTRAFDAWVHEITAVEGDFETRLRALLQAVRTHVNDEAGLLDHDADRMRLTGHGSRGLVASVALEALGVPHRLVLARPKIHVPAGPFLQVADFVYPLIEIQPHAQSALGPGPATPIWLDPGPDRAPVGFIPHIMLDGDALVAWPPEPLRLPVPLPETRTVHDQRRLKVRLRWATDGTITGEVEDRLEGQEAVVIGGHLARLDPEQRPRLVERLLVGSVGAAQVTALEDPIETRPPDGPLVLRYRFTASLPDRFSLGLFPVAPASTWARDAERDLPMAIELPTDQRVELELISERPLSHKARAVRHVQGDHHYELSVEADEHRLKLISHTRVAGGRVDPEGYAAFADWARQVEAAERISLTVGAEVADR